MNHILPSSKLIIDMHHEPFGRNIHSLNLTWPLKNGGWETILSFWGPAYFILFLTGAMLKGGQAINKIRLTNGHMLPGKGPRLIGPVETPSGQVAVFDFFVSRQVELLEESLAGL